MYFVVIYVKQQGVDLTFSASMVALSKEFKKGVCLCCFDI